MSISEDKIKRMMYVEQAVYDAETLLREKKVKVENTRNFWKGEATIRGNVDGYGCRLSVSKDQIDSIYCQCGNFGGKKGMCCHIGALALAYVRGSDTKSKKIVYTSQEADVILNKYRRRAIDSYQREGDLNNVGLAYEIMQHKEALAVSFFLTYGKGRYAIDSLNMFEENFNYGTSKSYGLKFSMLHSLDSFREEFRPMVEFMLKTIRRRRESEKLQEKMPHRFYELEEQQMMLLGDSVDEFMELCYGSGGEVLLRYGDFFKERKREVVLTDNNPDIEIAIEPIGNGGYRADMSGVDSLIRGDRRMYIVRDSIIYMADEVYTQVMSEFVTESVKAGYNSDTKSYRLIVSKKDMPAFSNLVITNIKKCCKIITHNMDMEEFEPWQLDSSFHIDMDVLTGRLYCKAAFAYKGEAVDIFGHISDINGICRDYQRESNLKSVLSKYLKRDTAENTYYTEDYRQIFWFLKNGISELEAFGDVTVSETVLNYDIIDSMKINANVSIDGDWLRLDIDAGEYSREELEALLEAYRQKEKYIRLGQNRIVKLDDNGLELMAQMAYDLDFSATDIINHQVFIPKYRALYVDGRLREGDLAAYDKDTAFRALVRTIKQVEDSEFLVPEELEDTLRGYQKYGFHWLRTLDACGFGGILADDMGLGKTIQIIALLLDEKLSVSRNIPSLVVAPASLVYNWESEIRHFAPQLNSVMVVGTKAKRREILEKHSSYDVLITSYELLKRDIDLYGDISFRFQIIDEAQSIKNFATENAKCVKKIMAQTRFALTGTPIENRLSELWSIFDYLMPGFLYSYRKFRDKFERPITVDNEITATKGLTRMIRPFVLRRLKKDVLKELPEKLEYDIYTRLEGKQHKLYVANALKLKDAIEHIDGERFGESRIAILSELMRLRQLCCDPSLCYEDYDGESSKLETCMDMVKNGIAGGHKILIFSQFTTMLEILGKRLEQEGVTFYTLTGSTPKEKRINMVNQFNSDDTNIFLISLKAGGVGLNLTGADMVIHYDLWWNVASENQASDRAHRIGQNKVVSVFKIISKGTIEEQIRELQKSKVQLADNVLNGDTISLGSLSKDELLSILIPRD